MNELKNKKHNIDDQLANFTDHILSEETTQKDENPFALGLELRALEKTALRLKNAYKDDRPSETVIQRMHQKIAMHQQQEIKEDVPFWKKLMLSKQGWHSQRSRQQLRLALSLTTVLILFLISTPLFIGASPDQPAASGQNLNFGILVASGGLFLLAVWLIRRKR